MEKAGPKTRGAEGRRLEAGSAAGKKRKKKKKEEKERNGGEKRREHTEGAALRGAKTVVPASTSGSSPPSLETTGFVSAVTAAPCPLSSSSYPKLSDECYSSSSSLEISRPMYKLGRFDFSSSDAMSGGQTSCSTMEASSAGHSASGSPHSKTRVSLCSDVNREHTLHAAKLAQVHSSINSEVPPSQLATSTQTGVCSSNDDTNFCSSVADSVLMSTSHNAVSVTTSRDNTESLRWKDECSDEERERERIELYKANRRKRYENARKNRFEHATDRKVPYYQSSETIS